jgi:hypothetical protein
MFSQALIPACVFSLRLLASLLLSAVLSGCPEEKATLPEFSERVHLEVSATWTADGECVDVVTVTNLPQGTTFRLLGQQRHPPDSMEKPDKLTSAQYELKVQVQAPRQEHKRVFCDEDDGWGVPNRESGMWLRITVGGPDSEFLEYQKPHDYALQRQEIGPLGEKLKGPLARRSSHGTFAGTKTFVLPGTHDYSWSKHGVIPR